MKVPGPPDAFDCYELCVQDATRMAAFLRAVHSGDPRILREDFAGTGGVCREWATDRTHKSVNPRRAGAPPRRRPALEARAIAVDLDPTPLKRLSLRLAGTPGGGRVRTVRANAADCRLRADVIAATNFPIGYWHTRADLLRYLRGVRASLRPGGVFVCDTYGGATAFQRGSLVRTCPAPGGWLIEQTWEQRDADPLTAMVTDVLHFAVRRAGAAGGRARHSSAARGRVVARYPEAFVYRWRLWSPPELRDAMLEAGFGHVEFYDRPADATDHRGRTYVQPIESGDDLDESFVIYAAARLRAPRGYADRWSGSIQA